MRIQSLFAHNPRAWTGSGNHTYLLDAGRPTLIDAGEGRPAHLDAVASALADDSLSCVLVTHAHPDHIDGAGAIRDRFGAPRCGKFPWPDRDARTGVTWEPLADGQLLDLGRVSLLVVHTPGHSPDHVCLLEPDSGVLFAGDLVVNGGTVVIPASNGGSLRQYLESLRRVLDLRPRRLLPAHGTPVEDPGPLLRAYLAHRAMRERQIVDVLAEAPCGAGELVARVYPGLDASLRTAAEESVLAHLVKLCEDGRAHRPEEAEADGRWHLASGAR
jgi:glyoxylase-like metal-dependent hydrolase (beta-lactamase superfamily II)